MTSNRPTRSPTDEESATSPASSDRPVDRRTFLQATGAAGVAAALGGCLGGGASTEADTTTEAPATTTTETTETETTTETPDTITVTDDYDREVEVSYPAESFATITPHVFWAMRLLGIQDQVVGVNAGDMAAFPEMQDKPGIGWYREPNVEKIAELDPDVLITHYRGPNAKTELDKIAEKLSKFDVAVVGIEITGMELENVGLLAKMAGMEEKIDPFFEWREEQLKLVEERVADVPEEEKKTVYFEAESSVWTAKHDLPIEVAGGYNVMNDIAEAAMDSRREVEVDPEKVMSVDPDFVLLEDVPNPSRVTGYGATDTKPATKMLDQFLDRPGVETLSAAENDQVHVVDYKLTSAEKSWLGAIYLGKLFYPDRFDDVDPAAIHEEYYTKWLNEGLQGTYLFPEPW
ncbi:ABC transporter substrate-binding protein [Halobacteriaceae archaeon GCM10025711]